MHYCNPVEDSAGLQVCRHAHKYTHLSVSASQMPKHFSSMLVNIQKNVQLLMYMVVVQKDPDHYWDLKNKCTARNYFCSKYRCKCHRVGGWHRTRIDACSRCYSQSLKINPRSPNF